MGWGLLLWCCRTPLPPPSLPFLSFFLCPNLTLDHNLSSSYPRSFYRANEAYSLLYFALLAYAIWGCARERRIAGLARYASANTSRTSVDMERYAEPRFEDEEEDGRRGAMLDGGDLGEGERLMRLSGEAGEGYKERESKSEEKA